MNRAQEPTEQNHKDHKQELEQLKTRCESLIRPQIPSISQQDKTKLKKLSKKIGKRIEKAGHLAKLQQVEAKLKQLNDLDEAQKQ